MPAENAMRSAGTASLTATADSASRKRSTSSAAPSAEVSGMTMRNSSPPQRATMSASRVA